MISQAVFLRRFMARILRRFIEENFDQISASLAFTTLLSLVPLVALVLGVISVLPVFNEMVQQIDHFVVRSLLPERSAELIIVHVLEFSQKAANFTVAGLLALIVTILFLLASVERAFNQVWRVRKDRSLWRKLRLSVVVVVLWPVVVTGVKATGTVVGWGVDAMTPSKPADHSGVVVKERISDPPPAAAPPATPTPPGTPP